MLQKSLTLMIEKKRRLKRRSTRISLDQTIKGGSVLAENSVPKSNRDSVVNVDQEDRIRL